MFNKGGKEETIKLRSYKLLSKEFKAAKGFYVLLTAHLIISLDSDQLDAHLLYFTIRPLQSATCFGHYMLIIRKLTFIDAASDIVTLSQWPSGATDGH